MRGLPWWYQTIAAALGTLSVAGLWATSLVDPGALTPSPTPGALCGCVCGCVEAA